jgi:adenylate cyclase
MGRPATRLTPLFAPAAATLPNSAVAALAEGDLRPVTVMFAEVRGFASLAEVLPSERLVQAINSVFQALDEPVARLGGEVDKFIGDTLMATFGAPVAHDDDPRRAVLAALEMQAAVRTMSQRLQVGCELDLRIGINTGLVLAGPIGSRRKRTYTVMGDAVNVASRLQHMAAPGGILVGEATRVHLGNTFRLRARRSLRIRGKGAPVRSFVVSGPAAAGQPARHRQYQCIGREAELAQLSAALAPVRLGSQAVVRIGGAMGTGKTQLLQALRDRHARRPWLVSACPPYGHDLPYATLAGLLRVVMAHLERSQPGRASADLIAEALATDGLDPRLAVGVVHDLLGIAAEPSDATMASLQPELRKGLLARTTKALLRRCAQRPGGCFVVVDDCQWLDPASASIIREAITDLQAVGLGWVFAHRPEWDLPADWPIDSHTELLPLPAAASADVVHSILGAAADAETVQFVVERAGGNPLHLVELCRALRSGPGGSAAPGGVREQVAGADGPRYLTDRLRALVQARVDALDPAARRVVNIAAILGHPFPVRLLRRVLGAGEWATVLQQLEEQEFLSREPLTGAGSQSRTWMWRFRHPLLQETTYASLLSSTRVTLHHAAGLALEDLPDAAIADRIALLALHFSRSDDRDRAIHYLWTAGERARERYLNREAIRYYDDALGRLGTTGEDRALRAEVLAGRGAALDVLADDEAAIDSLQAAIKLEQRPTRRTDLWREVAEIYRRRGAFDDARAGLRRATRALADGDSQLARARILIAESMLARDCRDYVKARVLGARAVALLEVTAELRDLAAAHRAVGIAAAQSDDLAAAQLALGHGLEAARTAQDSLLAATIATNLGTVLRYQGHYAEAHARYQESLAFYERIGAKRQIARTWINLGDLAWRDGSGDWDAAREFWDRALPLLDEIGDKRNIAVVVRNLGEGFTQRGAFSAAVPHLQRLIQLADDLADEELREAALRHLVQAGGLPPQAPITSPPAAATSST